MTKKSRTLHFFNNIKFGKMFFGIGCLILLLGNKPLFVYAESGQIVVADNAVIVQTNTICSLIEAIENANDTTTGQPHTDCNPGNPNGADVIVLPRRGEFVLTAVYPGVYPGNDDAFGLPTITSQIIIEGNGSTIMRQENAPDFGIFFIELGNLTINNAKITGAAGNHALYAFFSQLTIKNSDIFNNNSGGIAAGDSDLTLLDSEIFHNVNESFGGGIFVGWSSIYMRNTTVYENEANNGGGIAIRWGLGVNINNSTISGNASREHGGGIYFDGNANVNDVSISSSTITNNRAMSDGGGIYSAATFEATAIHLNHNLIAGNQAGAEGAEIKITSPDTIVAANNYNLFGHDGVNTSAAIDGFSPGSNDLIATSDGTDPAELGNILQPISKQAKLTPTHLLVPGSPAVDAIPADYAATDQHGISRPQGLAGDIGAVEVTFVDLTSIVENDVQTLKDNHEITKSQANRLRVFLIMASNQYQRGKITSAISWLNSFVDLVNDYIGQDILTTENGQSLIDDTEAILYQFTNQ